MRYHLTPTRLFLLLRKCCLSPARQASPAKLRLAFEAAPFGRLVEMAGGKTSDGVSGNSVLDMNLGLVGQWRLLGGLVGPLDFSRVAGFFFFHSNFYVKKNLWSLEKLNS